MATVFCECCGLKAGHSVWCPCPFVARDLQRPAQPLATEDWARALLAALNVDPNVLNVNTTRDAMVALHRHANAEGFAVAKDIAVGFVPVSPAGVATVDVVQKVGDPITKLQPIHVEQYAEDLKARLDEVHDQLKLVGVDQS